MNLRIAENYIDEFSTDESFVQEKQKTQIESLPHLVVEDPIQDSFHDYMTEDSSLTDYEDGVTENIESLSDDDSLQSNVFFHES